MRSSRFHQALLIGTLLPLCWFVMMPVHELGHVFGAWLTGGSVERVILHPLTISRTDLAANPNPIVVVWAGPIVGVLLPLTLLTGVRLAHAPGQAPIRFFVGFCLIANGAYIGIGSFELIGDAGDMIRHRTPPWCLWGFGLATIPLGLLLWNGLGQDFGLGQNAKPIAHRTAWTSCFLLVLIVTLECFLSERI
jgi:hypothetical protein